MASLPSSFLKADLTQQNDKKMSRETGNAQSRATFVRHSAVVRLPVVLLFSKLPNDDGNKEILPNALSSVGDCIKS